MEEPRAGCGLGAQPGDARPRGGGGGARTAVPSAALAASSHRLPGTRSGSSYPQHHAGREGARPLCRGALRGEAASGLCRWLSLGSQDSPSTGYTRSEWPWAAPPILGEGPACVRCSDSEGPWSQGEETVLQRRRACISE